MYTGLPKDCQKKNNNMFFENDLCFFGKRPSSFMCFFFGAFGQKGHNGYTASVGEHQHEWAMCGFWVYPTHACNWGELSRVQKSD